MEPNNRIWNLMARALSDEISAEENEELFGLLKQDPRLQQQYDIMKRLWIHEKLPTQDAEPGEEDRLHIARILQIAKKKQSETVLEEEQIIFIKKRRSRLIKRTVLSLAGLAIISFALYKWRDDKDYTAVKTPPPNQTITAQKGSKTRSVLPDGSTVWVNAGSSISYEGDFKGKLREVKLDGEAYFDVIKNPGKPFIVHTGGVDIKVLGTAFNVKSYAADKTVETTLIHGMVQVTRENDVQKRPIFLHPNEKLTLEKAPLGNTSLSAGKDSAPANQPVIKYTVTRLDTALSSNEYLETAWLYNRLAFRGDSFETLAQKLERWYNINIIFEDEKVKRLNFNGSFENESVEQAFEALKAAVPFNFKINTHDVSVSTK